MLSDLDFFDLEKVKELARSLRRPGFEQHVVKYPNRRNYNITMQLRKAQDAGAIIVWSTDPNVVEFWVLPDRIRDALERAAFFLKYGAEPGWL